MRIMGFSDAAAAPVYITTTDARPTFEMLRDLHARGIHYLSAWHVEHGDSSEIWLFPTIDVRRAVYDAKRKTVRWVEGVETTRLERALDIAA